jgi:hypothetical protein
LQERIRGVLVDGHIPHPVNINVKQLSNKP